MQATRVSKAADVSGATRMVERLDLSQQPAAPVHAEVPGAPANPLVKSPQAVSADPPGPQELPHEDPQTEQRLAVEV